MHQEMASLQVSQHNVEFRNKCLSALLQAALSDRDAALAQLSDRDAALAQLSDRDAALAQLSDRDAALVQLSDRDAALAPLSDRDAALAQRLNRQGWKFALSLFRICRSCCSLSKE